MGLLQFMQLLHLADSALPVGSAAHSYGLETLVIENGLEVPDLPRFFAEYLQEAGRLDAVFVNAGFDCGSTEEWQMLNQHLSALRSARETREASLRLAKRLAGLAAGAFGIPLVYPTEAAHLPLVFGQVGRLAGAEREEAAAAYLHQSLSGLVSACQRLLPLGQSGAATLLWQLKPVMLETLASVKKTAFDEVYLCQPLLDLASCRHPGLSTRLFIS